MPRKSLNAETVTLSAGNQSVTLAGEQFDNAANHITRNARKRAKQSEPEPEKLPIIQITKIKISLNDSSLLRYDRVTKNKETEHCELQFFGAIHPDFQDALDYFRRIAIDAIGLDESAWNTARVSGISLKHDDGIGLTITMQRKLEDAGLVVVVNTPFLNPDFLMGENNHINKLTKEAIACLNGKRAQMDLFSAAETAEEPE